MSLCAADCSRSGQYTVTLTAWNAVSSRTVSVDVFVLHSVCKPPDITLLPADHLHPVSLLHWLLRLVNAAKYCNEHVCLSVCLSVCSHNSKTMHMNFTKCFCACCLWPLVGPPLTALQYVMYFRFYGWRYCHAIKHDVIFMRSSPRGGRPTSLGGLLACKQCCCPGSQKHVTSDGLGYASQLVGHLSAYVSSHWLWLSKLPLHCGRVAACV